MKKAEFIRRIKNGQVALMKFRTTIISHTPFYGAERIVGSYQYEENIGSPSTITLLPFTFSPVDCIYEIRLDFNQFENIQCTCDFPFIQGAILIRVRIPHYYSEYFWDDCPAYPIFNINQYNIKSIWIVDTEIDIVVAIYSGDYCIIFKSAICEI